MKTARVLLPAILLALSLPLSLGQEAPGSGRQITLIDGIHVEFPADEADVIELLRPALVNFAAERESAAAEEADALAKFYADVELRASVRNRVAKLCAREEVSGGFAQRYDSHQPKFDDFAEAWRRWSGELGELQLWGRTELEPFKVAASDAGGGKIAFKFPQVSFSRDGSKFGLDVPMMNKLVAFDAWDSIDPDKTPNLRLDLPLRYRPGTSARDVATPCIEFVEKMPTFLRKQASSAIAEHLGEWLIEYLLLGEMEAGFFDPDTTRKTVLPAALARYLLFLHLAAKDGAEKTMARAPLLLPFVAADGRSPADAEAIAELMALDPLAPVKAKPRSPQHMAMRNLLTMALIDLTQQSGGTPVFHRLEEKGIAIPDGGFNAAGFAAAIDKAFGGDGMLAELVEEQKRKVAARFKPEAPEAAAGEEPETGSVGEGRPIPGRRAKDFGALTISYPDQLNEEIELIGPEYATIFKAGQEGARKLAAQVEPVKPLVVEQQDLDAFARYGLEAEPVVMRSFAAQTGYLSNMRSALIAILGSDKIQVWFKDDLKQLLKSGHQLADFSYDAATDTVGFEFNWGFSLTSKQGVPDAAAIAEKLAAIRLPNWPVVLDRDQYKKDAPAAADSPFMAHFRERSRDFLRALEAAAEGELDANLAGGQRLEMLDEKQIWFLVVHETAEFAIARSVVASPDRRWFCDGLANWIAIREVERRFGPGTGNATFRKFYDSQKLDAKAASVDLLAWPAAEDVDAGRVSEVEDQNAYYYFATLVIEAACEDQGEEFVKQWLTEIRQTKWNRTNAGTLLAAYQELTSRDLEEIIADTVR